MEVYDARGRRLVLTGTGRSGGEGTVFPVEGAARTVAKVYHPNKVDAELHDKIGAMAANPPDDPARDAGGHRSIAWVRELLFHDPQRRRFAGFTMPGLDTAVFREAHAYYDPADRLRRFAGAFTWRHLMTAAANLASAVAAVHAQGHRIGDLRETNVLVSPTALVSLIDCDSFQIRDVASGRVYPTRVGTAEYLPPELHGADFRDADHDRSHADRFALGVLVFKFLMGGAHPFQARGAAVADAPSIEAKIRKGLFPYTARLRAVEPPAFAPAWDVLPPSLRKLFRRCFVDGHRRPARRPSAEEWFRALRAEAARLRQCKVNPHHRYGHHQRACPWCRSAHTSGEDPFPTSIPVGTQRPAPVPRVVRRPSPPSVPAPVPVPAGPGPRARAAAMLGRVRARPRVAAVLAGAIVLAGAAFSPAGRADGAPQVAQIAWEATVRGTCPFDPAVQAAPPKGCRSDWRIGPLHRSSQEVRRWFVLVRARERLRVDYEVTYSGARACALPWVANLAFNRQAAAVCLASCPERIELRARGAGAPLPLIDAGGVGARSGTLRCGTAYRGSWTFDIGDAAGGHILHYPGFKDLPLPRT